MLVTHKTKCVTRILFTITHQIKICPFTFSLPIKYFQPYKKIIVSCHRAHLYVLGAGVYLQLQHFSSLILYFRKKKGCSISLVAEKRKHYNQVHYNRRYHFMVRSMQGQSYRQNTFNRIKKLQFRVIGLLYVLGACMCPQSKHFPSLVLYFRKRKVVQSRWQRKNKNFTAGYITTSATFLWSVPFMDNLTDRRKDGVINHTYIIIKFHFIGKTII